MTDTEKKQFLDQYHEIHGSLMRFCMVKSQGIMDAKDLANDVLLVGLENYHKLENKKALLSYLFTTANRICLNKLRQKKFGGSYDPEMAERIKDPSATGESGFDIALLYEALDQLPALQKEAVILFEISDLPIKEIMVIQDSGSSAVKQRIKRGREKLAELLSEKKEKKVTVILSALVASNSFSMSNLDAYFNAIKELPLPLSSTEASSLISNFQVSGTAVNASASKFGQALLKKGIIGGLISAAVIGATFMLSSQTANEKFTVVGHTDPVNLASKWQVSDTQSDTSSINYGAALALNNPENTIASADLTVLNSTDTSLKNRQEVLVSQLHTSLNPKKQVISTTKAAVLEGDIFSLAGVSKVLINNLGDNVEIRTWDKTEVQIIPNHRVEAKTPEDEALIRQHIEHKAEKKGDLLTLTSGICGSNRNSVSFGKKSINTITFGDGKKIKYKVIETNYVVMLPATLDLALKGQYKSITVPDLQGELETNLFESNFTCGSVQGTANLKMHYSKANLGNLQDVTLQLMESKVNFKDAKSVVLNAKYSTVNANRIASSTIESFESKITVEHIENGLEAGLKYTSLNVTSSNIKKGAIKAFESQINIPKMDELDLELRYGSLKMDQVEKLTISVSFESKITVNKAGEIRGSSSKYSVYSISNLAHSIEMNSFQDKLTIAKSGLSSMTFSGKYTTYAITLAQPANYQFDFDNNYGSLDYGDLNLTVVNSTTTNAHKIINGYFQNGNESAAKLTFNCFESAVKLN